MGYARDNISGVGRLSGKPDHPPAAYHSMLFIAAEAPQY
jgi:hypothetical protein